MKTRVFAVCGLLGAVLIARVLTASGSVLDDEILLTEGAQNDVFSHFAEQSSIRRRFLDHDQEEVSDALGPRPAGSKDSRTSLPLHNSDPVQTVEAGLAPEYILKGVDDRQPPWGIRERMKHWHVPGVSVAVLNNGVIEWAKGYGEAEAGGHSVDAETIFQTGSIGKTLTAMTALALVDRRVFDLDRDVGEYLVSWQLPRSKLAEGMPVTLEQILNHSAGLTVHGFGGYAPGMPLPTLRQMLDGESPCNSGPVLVREKPGTVWRYSGGGYLVAQQVIEDATGQKFADVVARRVLEPLRMTRTFYRSQLSGELRESAAMGHKANGAILSGSYRAMPEYGAGGGLWSTPSDILRLASSIMKARAGSEGEPITPKTARNMLTARFASYGLGITVLGEGNGFAFSHGGDNTGFHGYMIVFPALGQGAAIMTNGDQGTSLYMEILHAIADTYEWPDFRSRHSAVVDVGPARLESLAGSYEVTGIGRVALTVRDNALHIRSTSLPGGGDLIRLYPVDRFTFVDPIHGWAFAFGQDPAARTQRAEVTWGAYRLSAVKTR